MVKRLKLPIPLVLLAVAAILAVRPAWCGQFTTELVRIKTSDGVVLTGAWRAPTDQPARACLIMVHGYGGNFYSHLMSFLPEALAKAGFTTFAVNMRDHDLGPKKSRFEDNRPDIAAAVDAMARRQSAPIYLLGHSMGTNRVLYYLAATSDRRIHGLVLAAPPGDLSRWSEQVLGKEAAGQVLQQAQAEIARGNGDDLMLVDLGPLGKALYSARHVVSLRGPESCSDPFRDIAHVRAPVLIVHGLQDRLANPAVDDELRRSAPDPQTVAVVQIDGADHGFADQEKALTDSITDWLGNRLRRHALHPIPEQSHALAAR